MSLVKKSREEVRSPGDNLARTSVWKPWEEGSVKIKVKQEFAEQIGHGSNIFEPNGGKASEVVVKAKQESENRGTNLFETNDRETSVEEVCTVFVEVDVKKEQLESSEDALGQLLTQYLDAQGKKEDVRVSQPLSSEGGGREKRRHRSGKLSTVITLRQTLSI